MDIEKLTKSQIVLLTLLVSFVTSIATGIVAVSLMEQASPVVAQTVNRVVERTIEKVVPSQVAGASNVVTEKTVIVREQDLIAKAVEVVTPSVVRLFMNGKDETGKTIELFVGLAIVSHSDGTLFADSGTPEGELTALRSDGVSVSVKVVERPTGGNIMRLQAATSSKDKALEWRPATFSSVAPPLGETVVSISGRTSSRIASGLVTSLSDINEKDSAGGIVETNIPGDAFAAGSPLINTNGEIIGIATRGSREITAGGFLASSGIVSYGKKKEAGQAPSAPTQ